MKRLIFGGIFLVACSSGSLNGLASFGSALTVFSPTSTPAQTNVDQGYDVEVGVTFFADTAGTVNGVRFFKGTADTGTHTGHLWTSTGTLLATVVFSGESASGWQQMNFTSPIAITAGTRYIASYHTTTGFSWNDSFFNSQFDNPPLHIPVGGGVYTFGTNPSFPTSVYDHSNYWVDVDYTASTGNTSATLFADTQTPAGEEDAGMVSTEFGVKFSVDTSGVVHQLRFYKTPNDTGTHIGHVWDQYGTLLTSVTFTSETASGWQSQAVSVPVTTGQTYTASYATATKFGFDNNFFTAGIDHSPLHAPIAAGVYGNGGSYPQANFYQDNFWVDLEFDAAACTPSCAACNVADGCGGTCCGAAAYSVFSPSDAPASFTASSDYELGTKFSSAVGGTVTDLRFYQQPGDNGTHTGHLWDGGGHLLGSVTFPSSSFGGWQQATLPSAVAINPGQTYVVSYHSTTSFGYTLNYFASARSALPLSEPANAGVFGTGVNFPTQTFNSSNYWADVVFHPTPRAAQLFGSNSTPSFTQNGAGMPFELGVQFTSDVAGAVSKLFFYKDTANSGAHVGHLWDGSGTLLATVPFTNESASGWQEVTLPSPVAIAAATTYVASFSTSTGFAADQGFFGPGFDRPPLHVPAQGGVFSQTLNTFPNQTFNASNYWVDLFFQPAATGGSCVPACTGVACGAGDGCGGTCCSGSGCTPITTCDAQCQTVNTCGSSCNNVTDNTACTTGGQAGTCQAGACSPGAQHSVFNDMGSPASTYLGAEKYELGMEFSSDVAATATKVRFFKPAGAAGPHIGHIWDGGGTLLGTATFTSETASGWQEASLATPVSLTANTRYVVSYSEHTGFTYTIFGFSSALDVPPLHVPASGGVYGTEGTFPTLIYRSCNYWVDVVITN
jgi:hypothetical protein